MTVSEGYIYLPQPLDARLKGLKVENEISHRAYLFRGVDNPAAHWEEADTEWLTAFIIHLLPPGCDEPTLRRLTRDAYLLLYPEPANEAVVAALAAAELAINGTRGAKKALKEARRGLGPHQNGPGNWPYVHALHLCSEGNLARDLYSVCFAATHRSSDGDALIAEMIRAAIPNPFAIAPEGVVRVPQLIGRTAKEAQAQAEELGLRLVLRESPSGLTEPEEVFFQRPDAGFYVPCGASLSVTVAVAPQAGADEPRSRRSALAG